MNIALEKRNIIKVQMRALDFLKKSQTPDGFWRDFETRSSGASNEWVTGYICYHMSNCNRSDRNTIRKACLALEHVQRDNGGWGFQTSVPPDVDSTSFCLFALYSCDEVKSDTIQRAINFLLQHQHPSGGFSTYSSFEPLKSYRQRPNEYDFSGWCSPHVEVTGAAIQALLAGRIRKKSPIISAAFDYLCNEYNPKGYWESYWCCTNLYATNQAVAALKIIGSLSMFSTSISRYLCSIQLSDGSWGSGIDMTSCVFSTALGLSILMEVSPRQSKEQIVRGIHWLVAVEKEDGSWQSRPIMQIPPPNVIDPTQIKKWRYGERGVGSCSGDQNRLLTTATVLKAISQYYKYFFIKE